MAHANALRSLRDSSSDRTWPYIICLFAATVIWGAAFVVMKDSVNVMPPSKLIGLRFSIAGVLMLMIFYKRIRKHLTLRVLGLGSIAGALYCLGFVTQTIGLTDTTPGKNAFLTAAYCVMVPFSYWILSRKRPTVIQVACACLCLIGIGLVSLEGVSGIRFGDAMTLLCAVFFAFQIACIAKFAQEIDPIVLAFVQILVCGIISLIIGLITEPAVDWTYILAPAEIARLAFLTLGSSLAAGIMQVLGQALVPASQAALILSLEGVFGVLFSIMFYGEMLTLKVFSGFVIIFIAIVISETQGEKELPWLKKTISS